jgi:NAD(P)-dependent dehydrogenase (short-subunit alcohol dehydrogenase family)
MRMTMEDRVALVTGSTDGIGRETALGLARLGGRVLLHGRDPRKGRTVLEELRRKTGNENLELFWADLSSQRQVRSMAAEIKRRHGRLHVLLNNAGVFMKERRLTEDGFEMTFAVNHLAPFLLTHVLLDLLQRSAPSRIITVSSVAHFGATVDWSNLQGERRFDGYEAYALSKLCNILFTYELAGRLEGTKVTANCLHPGVIRTKLLRAGFGDIPGDDPEKGAKTPIYLASSPEVEGLSGLYFEGLRPGRTSPLSRDRRLQKKLWQISERLTETSWPSLSMSPE